MNATEITARHQAAVARVLAPATPELFWLPEETEAERQSARLGADAEAAHQARFHG